MPFVTTMNLPGIVYSESVLLLVRVSKNWDKVHSCLRHVLVKQIIWQNEPDIYTHVHENQASASLLKAFLVLFVYKCLKRIASMNCRFITSTWIDNFLPKLYFVNRGKEPVTFVKCDPENSTASGKGASEDDVASYAVWPSNFQPRVPILGDLIVQNYSHRHKTPLWWKKC